MSDIERRWNAGELPLLFAHPQSAGHGLNLQKGGASHICWFSPTWDLELYGQFVRRLFRQGTTADRVMNHLLIMEGTIDEIILAAIQDKTLTQAQLLQRLNSEILHVGGAPAGGGEDPATLQGDTTMALRKLGKLGDTGGSVSAAAAAPAAQAAPRDDAAIRAALRAKIAGQAPVQEEEDEDPKAAAQAVAEDVVAAVLAEEAPAEAPKRTRKAKTEGPKEEQVAAEYTLTVDTAKPRSRGVWLEVKAGPDGATVVASGSPAGGASDEDVLAHAVLLAKAVEAAYNSLTE